MSNATQFSIKDIDAESYENVTEDNFQAVLQYCRTLARTKPTHAYPPMLPPDAFSVVGGALSKSGMIDHDKEVKRFATRLGFESFMQDKGGRYMLDLLRVGDVVLVSIADEARLRQAVMRFKSRQPLWKFVMRKYRMANNQDTHLLTLCRTE